MFEKMTPLSESGKAAVKAETAALEARLAIQQQQIKEAGLPVIVLLEGWGASGKGSLIRDIIRSIDPRSFCVCPIVPPVEEEARRPFLWRYFEKIPPKGRFLFLDSGWYGETVKNVMEDGLENGAYASRVHSLNVFERQLCDNGYLVVKLFLHISKETQDERFEKLLESRDTSWRVSALDRLENKRYKKYAAVWDSLLDATDSPWAPWYLIDGSERAKRLQALQVLTQSIAAALEGRRSAWEIPGELFPLLPMPKLAEVSLDQQVPEEEYRIRLKDAQKRLQALHNRLYRKQVPVVIVYEGWDAAGKGGNIKRIAAALDPRGYEVVPVAAPEPQELARHYLWRFWTRLPKTGHISIFDRSWYGRVMVERIEKLCPDEAWQRAYQEINEFERELHDWGAVVLKFWVHIDPETQLERFRERENTPEKRWKITAEDWRNREKWPQYEEAVDEMLQKTSTAYAPWHIIESRDKHYARLKAIETVIEALETALD